MFLLSRLAAIAVLFFSVPAAWGQSSLGTFPVNFHWCVATSGHQVEGHDTTSDWHAWESVPGHIKNNEVSGEACDEWNRLPEDVHLMRELGIDTYRFSVEWAKIEPSEGDFDAGAIAHYKREVALLKKSGISPMITLQHFTLPEWLRLKGGWEYAGAPEAFARFAALVYDRIAPGARDWITINEPMVHVMGGYLTGIMPPGEKRPMSGLVPVLTGLLKAHAAAYHVLHAEALKAGHDIRVGMAHHLRTFDPYNAFSPLDILGAHISDEAWNWMIPDALQTGVLHFDVLWYVDAEVTIPQLKGTQDFFGMNYYTGDLIELSLTHGIVRHNRKNLPKTDLGWDIYPEGFEILLKEVGRRYREMPVFVTENGIADASDLKRPQFILQHLERLKNALAAGVPVEGYCYWSLMDNFEWTEGFGPRFGLFETDYQTFDRVPRPSAKLFSDIIRESKPQ